MKRKVATYGELLGRLMEETGLSAYRLARRAGVTAASLSLILSNQRKPNVETLERMLRAAGKTWAWMDANLAAVGLPAEEG